MRLNRKYKVFFLSISFVCVCISILVFWNKNRKQLNPSLPIITEATYLELPGWENAEIYTAKIALEESCKKILKKQDTTKIKFFDISINLGGYKAFCIQLNNVKNNKELKKLVEANFYPVKIEALKEKTLFTGYIELEIKGRLEFSQSDAPNAVPIYKKPNNLITIDLGLFDDELKNKKITGLIENNQFVPASTREQIEKFNIYKDNIIAYIDDPARAYFLHIQGSGIIKLPKGKNISVGYDGDNGHEYFSIGRKLIKEGTITKENMSMQSITNWMQKNVKEATLLRYNNKRFIFFKERRSAAGPIGASGAIVTPMHSAAIDNNFLPYHLPLWADVQNFFTDRSDQKHSNLFLAQDTGAAIKGPTRIDLFLGKGVYPEKTAGRLNSSGSLWAFIPK